MRTSPAGSSRVSRTSFQNPPMSCSRDCRRIRTSSFWEHAKARGFAIVTADADFYELSTTFGPPPKVIWLRGCDYPTAVAEGLIRNQAIRIAEFLQNEDQGVLVLTP